MIPEAGDRHGQPGMIYPTPRPATFSFYHLLMAWKGDVRGILLCFSIASDFDILESPGVQEGYKKGNPDVRA